MLEPELVERLKKGDEGAFRALVETFQPLVLNCCYRIVTDQESARDLTQDVFVEVFRSIHQFRSESKLSTWIYRIAMAKSLDHLKAQRRKKRFGVVRSFFSGEPEDVGMLQSDTPNPHQTLELEERRRVLSVAIESLPDNQRVAFTLSKYDELSYQEIADTLGTTVAAVESLIFRAKGTIRKKLVKYYDEHL
jgi:RNA polymerase sigma-70 factor, ECF subfamily